VNTLNKAPTATSMDSSFPTSMSTFGIIKLLKFFQGGNGIWLLF
jgi:hypothetical protein